MEELKKLLTECKARDMSACFFFCFFFFPLAQRGGDEICLWALPDSSTVPVRPKGRGRGTVEMGSRGIPGQIPTTGSTPAAPSAVTPARGAGAGAASLRQ